MFNLDVGAKEAGCCGNYVQIGEFLLIDVLNQLYKSDFYPIFFSIFSSLPVETEIDDEPRPAGESLVYPDFSSSA